jgi:hypothetical protein
MSYGEHGGATGWIVGEPNRGLEYMFIMMNLARYSVGLEGVGLSERAYQRAVAFARERVQGRAVGLDKGAKAGAIIEHPDVRRMLMTMRAWTEAIRAVAYVTGAALDNAAKHPDPDARKRHQAFADLMIPIVKGHSTEVGQDVASLGLQVHGGMGFIEETGAAQLYRDARITTIYEGTTGIQANDLIGRKIARDGGKALLSAIERMRGVQGKLAAAGSDELALIGKRVRAAVDALEEAAQWIVERQRAEPRAVLAGAGPFLELAGTVCGGVELGRAALAAARRLAAGDGDADFLRAKIATSRHFAEHCLTKAPGLRDTIVEGSESVLALAEAQF